MVTEWPELLGNICQNASLCRGEKQNALHLHPSNPFWPCLTYHSLLEAVEKNGLWKGCGSDGNCWEELRKGLKIPTDGFQQRQMQRATSLTTEQSTQLQLEICTWSWLRSWTKMTSLKRLQRQQGLAQKYSQEQAFPASFFLCMGGFSLLIFFI